MVETRLYKIIVKHADVFKLLGGNALIKSSSMHDRRSRNEQTWFEKCETEMRKLHHTQTI